MLAFSCAFFLSLLCNFNWFFAGFSENLRYNYTLFCGCWFTWWILSSLQRVTLKREWKKKNNMNNAHPWRDERVWKSFLMRIVVIIIIKMSLVARTVFTLSRCYLSMLFYNKNDFFFVWLRNVHLVAFLWAMGINSVGHKSRLFDTDVKIWWKSFSSDPDQNYVGDARSFEVQNFELKNWLLNSK